MLAAMASMVRTMPSFVTVLPNWSGKRSSSPRSLTSGKSRNFMTTSEPDPSQKQPQCKAHPTADGS
eukprot:8086735-Heterocapsa_arctica.AAC.1